jgi:hypothetical protein
MSVPQLIVMLGAAYLGVGVCVALVFAFGLVSRVVPSAAGGSPLFRLLIVPGSTLLWPLVLARSVQTLRRRP